MAVFQNNWRFTGGTRGGKARFLLFGGLDAFIEMPVPRELFSGALVEFCMDHYLRMWPLNEWLLELEERERSGHGQGSSMEVKKPSL